MKINYSSNVPEAQQNVKPRRKDKSQERGWKGTLTLYFKRAVLLGIAIFLSAVGWSVFKFAWKSPYFAMENMDITSTDHISKDEVITEAGVLPRTNLARISAREIENRIRQNTWVKSVSVVKHYPSTLTIRISERKPVALVVGNRTWGIDDQGRVLPGLHASAATQYPLITISDKLNLADSDKIESDVMKQTLYILTKIKHDRPDLLSQISEINITNPDNIVLYTQPDGTEIRLGNENLDERLSKFYKIWKIAQDRKMVHEYIDLRFDEQGVVTKPKIVHNPKKLKSPST